MPTSRKVISCRECGRDMTVGSEATSGLCTACLSSRITRSMEAPDGKSVRPKDLGLAGKMQKLAAECGNRDKDGCLWRDKGCLLIEGKRCVTFEKVALVPLRRAGGDLANCVKAYLRLHPVVASEVVKATGERVCRDCEAPVGPYKHLCDKCRAAAKRTAVNKVYAGRRKAKP